MTTSIVSVSETESKIQVNGADALTLNSAGDIGGIRSINGGQLAGMRNKIINGNMLLSFRGTSFPAVANGQYTVDRFRSQFDATGAVTTATRSGDIPSAEYLYSLQHTVTTADASIGAGEVYRVFQCIEGYDIRDLLNRPFTISFWVRSAKVGTHCIALTNDTGGASYILEYSVSLANNWEHKKLTVPGGITIVGAGWNFGPLTGLRVSWIMACGSTFQNAANTWHAGHFLATANQVNCLDAIGNTFGITGVQLEPGSVSTPFEHRPVGIELALCQRYYSKYAIPTFTHVVNSGMTGRYPIHVAFPTSMRATPTILLSDILSNEGTTYNLNSSVSGFCADWTFGTVGIAAISFTYAAEAEL